VIFSVIDSRPLFLGRQFDSENQMGPPTNLGGYWTNDSAIGTFDHHNAGWVDVRPGQGYASRWGASEHGTGHSGPPTILAGGIGVAPHTLNLKEVGLA